MEPNDLQELALADGPSTVAEASDGQSVSGIPPEAAAPAPPESTATAAAAPDSNPGAAVPPPTPAAPPEPNYRELFEQAQRQYQQIAEDPYVHHYRQNAVQFNAWLQEQQQRQQAVEAKKAKVWDPPAQRAEVEQYLKQYWAADPQTGEFRPKANTPPDVLQKVHQYEQYTRSWSDRLVHDPVAALEPLIQAAAGKLIESQIGQYQTRQLAQQTLARNQEWLFASDPKTGQRTYTPEGRRYAQYIFDLDKAGVTDVEQQDYLARRLLAGEMALAKVQASGQQQKKTEQFVQRSTRAPNVTPASQPVPTPTNQLSLVEALRNATAHIPDSDFESNEAA